MKGAKQEKKMQNRGRGTTSVGGVDDVEQCLTTEDNRRRIGGAVRKYSIRVKL